MLNNYKHSIQKQKQPSKVIKTPNHTQKQAQSNSTKCVQKAHSSLPLSLPLSKAPPKHHLRMEEEEGMPPFWLQNNNRSRRLRHRTSSLLLNSGLVLIFLLAIAFVFIFIVIPSFLNFTSKIFRPNSVKKSWDSLNLVLVLFAIVCGFLSRTNNNNNNNNNESPSSFANTSQDVQKSNPSTPHRWYDQYSSDRTAYNTLMQRQRSSSYPDLRQESSWVTSEDRWRSYDDTHVNNYHSLTSDQLYHRRPKRDIIEEEGEGVASSKDIGVDTFVAQEKKVPYTSPPPPPQHSSPPLPPSPSPPPPQLPPKVVKRKVKRTYEDLPPKERPENKNLDIKKYQPPPPSPPPQPPPPPPPPPPLFSNNEKKRGGASATKDFLISLRRKKKKQRQKSVENLESFFNPEPSSTLPLYPPPSPPPPPPPPPQFFQNIFSSKKSKNKKVHSVPPPPPPPPPPLVSEARASKTKAQNTPITTHKPLSPVKISNYRRVEDNVNTGNESPLNIPIPPPPPPPFKMPELKFVVHGDYVRIKAYDSPRSVSPDSDGVDDPMSKETSSSDGGDSPMSPFCPSPDVDTKADNFIARFRAGLRLEKMNSVRGRSNLGLQASSSHDAEEGEGPS